MYYVRERVTGRVGRRVVISHTFSHMSTSTSIPISSIIVTQKYLQDKTFAPKPLISFRLLESKLSGISSVGFFFFFPLARGQLTNHKLALFSC
jgi:hypothetical protein